MFVACRYCRTPLQDPESRRLGYGPDCAEKYNLPHGRSPHGGGVDGQEQLPIPGTVVPRPRTSGGGR
jgi:hypothetical protein